MYRITQRLMDMIDDRQVPVGMQCFTGDHTLIEVMGSAGMDYVWIDSEHSGINPRALEDSIRVADGAGLSTIVRIPEPDDTTSARRALEAGAEGIVVPMVRSAGDIENLLDALRYPPNGRRGICPAYRAAGYAISTFTDYAEASDASLLLIPMIETVDGLEHVEEICAIPEVKIVVFAAGELSFALGENANADIHGNDKILAAHQRVKAAAWENDVVLLGGPILGPTAESCAKALEDDIGVFCLGIDVMSFRKVVEDAVGAANAAVAGSPAYTRPAAPPSGFFSR
ncbi:HpcH/HpaI aldolase family protein [Glaciibacter flavus]|uniref:HpcH/HpaI aldolase family protein n=1 Tax=Orlajensenia flava TaxID=2565934 RepID=UPI003AFFF66D